MLKIKPPDYKFCPFCGQKLQTVIKEGEEFKHCPNDKWTYYPSVDQTANAIIVQNGKILLSQRNRQPHKGKWMLPAGFLSYGEHPKDTIIREVKEETGLVVKNPVFFDVLQTKDDPRSTGSLAFFYRVKAKGKLINGDSNENLDVRWFNLEKVPEIAWRDHKKIIDKLRKKQL